MSLPKSCPRCGAELRQDGLCPACLMENAAWSQTLASPDDPALAPTVEDPSRGQSPPRLPESHPEESHLGGYRIIRTLGRGGMGAVYEAEQEDSGRRVALKVLSHKLDSAEARERFLREGRLAASINHPNSVYVFGTEELEGTPAITMEIVPGGTLQEKVKERGPLPISQAVDAIRQVISGLECAQAVGILHRDVKPSNCFLDEDGVAKIGDFGLSISTERHEQSDLTVQGTLLGTPAFSSPEQLRGEELNARSDMYSVGATLYYLLTGHAPFEEGNMIKLLSRVLEEPAPNPRAARPEIPPNLSRIVLRCLSKTPADRFRNYADLRKALEPYGTNSPTAATLALRFGAYAIDSVILGSAGFALQALAWGSIGEVFLEENQGSPRQLALAAGLNLLMAGYFGLTEGVWGASLGKRLMGLRLARSQSSHAGFLRAFLRCATLLTVISLPYWLTVTINPGWVLGNDHWIPSAVLGLANLLVIGLLFSTARRTNGYAGLHGLLTDTRVIHASPKTKRPALTLDDSKANPDVEGMRKVGPYHVIEPLGESPEGQWFVAFDTKLLRRIWVHEVREGTPAVPAQLRTLNRQGRIRWITGLRSARANWDAYEAPGGAALCALTPPQPWASVRFWLHDLAEELDRGRSDDNLPPSLSLDRVWITADGHAKLLDFPAPGTKQPHPESADPDAFIREVARSLLESPRPPLPLHAVRLLDPDTKSHEPLVEGLRRSIRLPAMVSRLRRLSICIGVSLIPLIGIAFTLLFLLIQQDAMDKNEDIIKLRSALDVLASTTNEEERQVVRRYLYEHHRDVIEDPATWKGYRANLLIDFKRQQEARDAIAIDPEVMMDSPADGHSDSDYNISAIKTRLSLSAGESTPDKVREYAPAILCFTMFLSYGALPSILMALAQRRGLIFRMLGVVVVTGNGQPASRLRATGRALLAWSPFVLALSAIPLVPMIGFIKTIALVGVAITGVAIASLSCRDRSLQDRLAGTWLVPN